MMILDMGSYLLAHFFKLHAIFAHHSANKLATGTGIPVIRDAISLSTPKVEDIYVVLLVIVVTNSDAKRQTTGEELARRATAIASKPRGGKNLGLDGCKGTQIVRDTD